MSRRIFTILILLAAALLCVFGGCGKDKAPRYTPATIGGYPYPFGTDVKRLLGSEVWEPDSTACPHYRTYWLRNPPFPSRWLGYSSVSVTADSAGTLQGFGAARSFKSSAEAQAAYNSLLVEIRRRYGAPTDSTLVNGVVLRRQWRDISGSVLEVYELTPRGEWTVQSVSAKLRKQCGLLSI